MPFLSFTDLSFSQDFISSDGCFVFSFPRFPRELFFSCCPVDEALFFVASPRNSPCQSFFFFEFKSPSLRESATVGLSPILLCKNYRTAICAHLFLRIFSPSRLLHNLECLELPATPYRLPVCPKRLLRRFTFSFFIIFSFCFFLDRPTFRPFFVFFFLRAYHIHLAFFLIPGKFSFPPVAFSPFVFVSLTYHSK